MAAETDSLVRNDKTDRAPLGGFPSRGAVFIAQRLLAQAEEYGR